MTQRPVVYPYIPNSAPAAKAAMLAAVGAASIDELYAEIPEHLRLKRALDLPKPLLSEAALVRHMDGLLSRNRSTRQTLSFLGAGSYSHHVPAVCDEINSRGEFLTAYAGEPYEDHGRFQALFEYESLMAELLNMDVVNVPNYDGFQATATALRMAARVTGRSRVLLAGPIDPDRLAMVRNYLQPDVVIDLLPTVTDAGRIDRAALATAITETHAAVYFENPSYLGVIETEPGDIVGLAHGSGALCVASVDPISLGVLKPPADYGADIACGDIQALGIHTWCGGGHGGFIATHDDPVLVHEFPSRLFGVAPTTTPGEYGFGDVAYERTSFAIREEGKEWVGTAAALWGITAGVYLALMGPQGMVELGAGLLQRSRYAMQRLSAVPGVRVPFAASPCFKEFVVNVDGTGKSVAMINKALLARGIFGGRDLSAAFPELGQSLLVCVTEVHTQADIDMLAEALAEVTR